MTVLAKRRLDYTAPNFLVSNVFLDIVLNESKTIVTSQLDVTRQGSHDRPLVLDGHELKLVSVAINDEVVTDYQQSTNELSINTTLDAFKLTIVVEINPSANTALEGLYLSGGAYCTQCEAEGFRSITYFIDRPDVLSEYKVKITGSTSLPYILCNGNLIDSGTNTDGTHWVTWHDPHPKPCYLFALVAGDFDVLKDTFTTRSGRQVALELFVDKGKLNRGQFALDSLKRAMAWDEQVFDLEYDLDIYMVVAVDFFNMGAMENKGLNVFNSKFVLVDEESATDEDFFNVESVIAHEYFHNWTGNRVTCRDWFQLSLKEGLTVFRDQQFSTDMTSALSNRIKQVRVMREHQFAEDASAMSHPIRPDEVIEMNNFYTVTVYDKGAEVIRMMYTLLGKSDFKKGMDIYFERHDGQAVTCEDFVNAMQAATEKDLANFRRWYSQSGTPVVSVERSMVSDGSTQISLSQKTPATADQTLKQPLTLPLRIELIDEQGNHYQDDDGLIQDGIFVLEQENAVLNVSNATSEVIPVLLGDFSAPVKVNQTLTPANLLSIFTYATDQFSRWDALQRLYDLCITQLTESPDSCISDTVWNGLEEAFTNESNNIELLGECLVVPSFETLCQSRTNIEVEPLLAAREAFVNQFAHRFADKLFEIYNTCNKVTGGYEQNAVNARRCKNVILSLIAKVDRLNGVVKTQFDNATCMTDSLAALKAAQASCHEHFDGMMAQFESKWKDDPLVLDKWFTLHATEQNDNILAKLTMLLEHPQFSQSNPNRVRAVIGSFAFYNSKGFHAKDGSGYKYVADYLMKLDKVNPQVASRIVTPLTQWQQFSVKHQSLMKQHLGRLLNHEGLSKDVFEKVSKSLSYDENSVF